MGSVATRRLAGVAAVALLAAASQASATGDRSRAACGTVVGPAWSMPAFGKEGTKWLVGARGVRCPFAKQWASRLMRTPWRGEAGTVLRGPAGWNCMPRVGGALGTRGTPGECRKGGKLFFWGAAV